MKNEENTKKQRAVVANAKALKKEQQRLAEEQKLKLEREVAYKEFQKAQEQKFIKSYYQRMVHQNTTRIVKAFVLNLQEKIWMKKVAELSKLSPKKKIACLKFTIDYYQQCKTIYIIFEVEKKCGFTLDLSIYRNYLFPKILSTLNIINPEFYKDILFRTGLCTNTVDEILEQYFQFCDTTEVINYISLTDTVYKNLIDEFSSEFYKSAISSLNKCLINTIEKCAKTHKLDITKVSEYEGKGKKLTSLHYKNLASNLYITHNDYYIYNDKYEDEDDYRKHFKTLKTGVQYYQGCYQCNTEKRYAITFHNGFDPKRKMYSIVYNNIHYTCVNINNLFKQLLEEGFINDKPICENCCKKNEVDKEVSMVMVMSKLSGLVYIREPKYEFTYLMNLNKDDMDRNPIIECVTITLPIKSCDDYDDDDYDQEFNKIQIIKQKHFFDSKNIEYFARVPYYNQYELWTPVSDVTISFRKMLITFCLCNSLSYRIPDHIVRYIFSFIMIPNITSDPYWHKDIDLKQLDNSKLIEKFVNSLNFYDYSAFTNDKMNNFII